MLLDDAMTLLLTRYFAAVEGSYLIRQLLLAAMPLRCRCC